MAVVACPQLTFLQVLAVGGRTGLWIPSAPHIDSMSVSSANGIEDISV